MQWTGGHVSLEEQIQASDSEGDDDGSWRLAYEPVYAALSGETKSENYKHVIARIALVNELCMDARIEALWQKWGGWTGTNDAVLRVAQTLEVLAEAADLEHRGALVESFRKGKPGEINRIHACIVSKLECTKIKDNLYKCRQVDEALEAQDQFLDCLNNLDIPRIIDDAIVFVRDQWKLSWPWLAMELVLDFYLGAWGFATGQVMRSDAWVEYPKPPAPEFEVTFSTRPDKGETFWQALERFLGFFVDSIEQLTHAALRQFRPLPWGRFPSEQGEELIRRNVNWFYRNRFREASIRSLAHEYHDLVHMDRDFSGCDDRSTIRKGIAEAFRLLSLTQYEFKDAAGPLGK